MFLPTVFQMFAEVLNKSSPMQSLINYGNEKASNSSIHLKPTIRLTLGVQPGLYHSGTSQPFLKC